jgi:hypothetical protein
MSYVPRQKFHKDDTNEVLAQKLNAMANDLSRSISQSKGGLVTQIVSTGSGVSSGSSSSVGTDDDAQALIWMEW